ncbi:hypothetical protein GCM10009122_32540 [Fulvivirga kasyanovii]|jgi:hypothetical protein|uniref:PreQ0 transporter n=1 Tax=Fulvivirga kasyanovii TaxID=396812 RepID=A0ABW9RJ30_9BACT|nr:hypothetical protein [Fulvivirga kasyanovii]MTI23433.1 hypothetical protein [Fulvivirga kasyanovii]
MNEFHSSIGKRLIVWIALTSFVLHFIWENLHASLYAEYDYFMKSIYFLGCTLGDVMLTFIIYGLVAAVLKDRFWIRNFNFKSLPVVVIMAGVVSFIAEWVAIELDFWSYNEKMPIVPLLGVGLSPFLAIVINNTLSFLLASKIVVPKKK